MSHKHTRTHTCARATRRQSIALKLPYFCCIYCTTIIAKCDHRELLKIIRFRKKKKKKRKEKLLTFMETIIIRVCYKTKKKHTSQSRPNVLLYYVLLLLLFCSVPPRPQDFMIDYFYLFFGINLFDCQ